MGIKLLLPPFGPFGAFKMEKSVVISLNHVTCIYCWEKAEGGGEMIMCAQGWLEALGRGLGEN